MCCMTLEVLIMMRSCDFRIGSTRDAAPSPLSLDSFSELDRGMAAEEVTWVE